MNTSDYIAVQPEFYEALDELIHENEPVKINYFTEGDKIKQTKGIILHVDTDDDCNDVVVLSNSIQIPVDRIITYNGKVGPAYDKYDDYANESVSCMRSCDK